MSDDVIALPGVMVGDERARVRPRAGVAQLRGPTLDPVLGRRVLGVSLLFGLAADALLRVMPWGLNVTIVVALGVLAAVAVTRGRVAGVALEGEGRWLVAPMLFFAGALAWRDSPTLTTANSLALAACVALAMVSGRAGQLRRAGVAQYLLGVVYALLHAIGGLLPVVMVDTRWRIVTAGAWTGTALALARGVALAVPVLLLFGSLLAAADANFERLARRLLEVDAADLAVRIGLTALYAWVAGGLLREMLLAPERPKEDFDGARRFSLGPVEVGVVLAGLDLLFAAFVAVQARYLFGGMTQVAALGFSEYARRGFFELVWVAGLTLPLLLWAHWLTRAESHPRRLRAFRLLGGTTVALLYVIMASAAMRMRLYVEDSGLTELRVQASAFMVWLAVVLAWFVATVLRGQRRRFGFGVLVSALLAVAALDLVNPDDAIVRVNAAHGHLAGTSFDERPFASFSADAAPAIADALPTLSEPWRTQVEQHLRQKWSGPSGRGDWRAFNWARARAREAVG